MSGQPKRKVKAVASGLLWHAVLSSPPVEWQQLSTITRGIADEILRRLDHQNAIVPAPGKTVYDAVCHAVAAHPRERRRVNEAIDELVAARWAAILPDRFVAYFPDLGDVRPPRVGPVDEHTRPTPQAHVEHTPSTHEANSAISHETASASQAPPAREESRGEERRVEEKREEPRAHDRLAWRATELPLLAELKKHQIVFSELVGPSWTRVVNWVLDFSENGPPTSKIIEAMSRGFALNQKAKLHGYPLSYLVTNPRQYYDEGLRAGGPVEETYDDEEHPL